MVGGHGVRILHDMPQRSPEWHQARVGILTASVADALTATGKGGKESAARRDLRCRLALERITGVSGERVFDNPDMQRGRELEAEALAAYETRTGTMLDALGFVSWDDLPIGCSPDGALMRNAETIGGGVDVKAPRPANHLAYLKNPASLIADYEAQMAHTLLVTDAPWWDLASYCPSFPRAACLLVVRVLRSGPLNHFIAEVPPFAQAVDVAAYELLVRAFLKEVDAEVTEIRRIAGLDDQEAA